MAVLSNPRHERFCQYLAQGKTAVEAYEQAGFKRDDGNAVRLTKKPAISARVQELTGQAAARANITAESLIQQAQTLYDRALESGQLSAGISAVKEIGVLSGKRVERGEVGAPGEFDHLSDEELERAVVERFARWTTHVLGDDELERAIVERFCALGLTPDAGGDAQH